MKSVAVILASAALASAQVTFNETTGQFTCAKPNANYCAGDSLSTNIIIRCDATGRGFPGNCNDNLAGEPPVGVNPASCFQTSNTSGDAACAKNCVVYAAPSFTLPGSVCVPTFTASSSTVPPTSTSTSVSVSVSTSTSTYSKPPTSSTTTSPPESCSTSTTTKSPTTLSTLPCTTSTTTAGPTGPPAGNGTCHSCGGQSTSNTPVGPTKTSSPTTVVTAGAAVQQVGGTIALVGLVAAYFL